MGVRCSELQLLRLLDFAVQLHASSIEELDTGRLKRPSKDVKGSVLRRVLVAFKIPNSGVAYLGLLRQPLLRPIQKCASGAALGGCDHGAF